MFAFADSFEQLALARFLMSFVGAGFVIGIRMVGAYGNVGAVLFLTVLSFVSPSVFFTVIAVGALIVLVAVQFIEEPTGHMVEDGTVEMIELD